MMKNYDVSRLNKRVDFYIYYGNDDGAGGKTDNWNDKLGYKKLFSRWAEIRPLSGRSFYQAKMMQEETTHDVIIRFNKSLSNIPVSLISINYNGTRLDVEYIIDVDNKHTFMKLRCTQNNGKRKR